MQRTIVVIPRDPNREELREICDDVTEYSDFVQKQTGLSGQELFDETRVRYSKIGWAPWQDLTWKPREDDAS